MIKQKILGTGLSGLVGSRIVELLSDEFEFEDISRKTGTDIVNFQDVLARFKTSNAPFVLHLAAYTDVKGAEKEKELKEKSDAWMINVAGTQNIARACQETRKRIIYVSTDLVLGGDNMPKGGFKEDELPNPLSWYAVTKYEAEKEIEKINSAWTIVRIAYPYRAIFEKTDFVRFFRDWLKSGKTISVLTDRLITPTFIDDLVNVFKILMEKEATGVFHAVGNQAVSLYDAAVMIAENFNLDKALIKKTTRAEFLANRPPEPFSSTLSNAKIKQLGVQMHSFADGLKAIKEQL
ncbi:sugar nucleotide-binding protein [Patescibacteria group bacterium]|nr:sugar nucleotide-binding protein [Patescibacteria group bacterium]